MQIGGGEMTPSGSYDGSRDLSDIEHFLQRACGALGRLRAEQMTRGLPPASTPSQTQPADAADTPSEHDAAVAESLAMMDDELRAAIDAALVAQYPRLQRLRERVGADAYDDDDEWAVFDHRDRARLRFAVWLLRRGILSEWRASVSGSPAETDETTPERLQGAG